MTPDLPGHCHRCGEPGHWADSCEWLKPAASREEHESRIDSLIERWQQHLITRRQKQAFIGDEIKLEKKRKVRSNS